MPCCTPNSLCFELLKGLPAALVALLIGSIAALIAWRQATVAQAKLKIDLFEKRLGIYDAVIEFIEKRGSNLSDPNYSIRFNNATAAARFLFGSDVVQYIERVRDAVVLVSQKHRELQAAKLYQPDALTREIIQKEEWLREQLHEAAGVFEPYLGLSRWT